MSSGFLSKYYTKSPTKSVLTKHTVLYTKDDRRMDDGRMYDEQTADAMPKYTKIMQTNIVV